MKEGGTSLHKTIREINLVYKGLINEDKVDGYQGFLLFFFAHTMHGFTTL